MKTVNISDLRARLSAHIQLVRDGEEIVVCVRKVRVARIMPVRIKDRSEQEKRLVTRGILIPPLKKRSASTRWPEPPGDVSDETMERIWRKERDNR